MIHSVLPYTDASNWQTASLLCSWQLDVFSPFMRTEHNEATKEAAVHLPKIKRKRETANLLVYYRYVPGQQREPVLHTLL